MEQVRQLALRLVAVCLCVLLLASGGWGLPLHSSDNTDTDNTLQHHSQEHRPAPRWPSLCGKLCRSWDVLCLSECSRLMPPNFRAEAKRSALPFDDKLGNLSWHEDYKVYMNIYSTPP